LWGPGGAPAHVRTDARPLRLPLRSPLAWRLVGSFFLVSSVFYGLSAWLPDAYTERGWSESSAGALIAVVTGVSIPCAFLVGWLADRIGSRRAPRFRAAATRFPGPPRGGRVPARALP